MKKLVLTLRSALYNISRNKAYAVFCILGTALTFVFITIVLQLTHILTQDVAPQIHAGRTVRLPDLQNTEGRYLPVNEQLINIFAPAVENSEGFALSHMEPVNVWVNDFVNAANVSFVNGEYWKINRFDFVAGKPFGAEDGSDQLPVAVITRDLARTYFKSENPIGKKIDLQDNEYKIVGVVKDFSVLSMGWNGDAPSVWIPAKYNKFLPSGDVSYSVDFLFPETMPVEQMKASVAKTVKFYYTHWGVEPDISADRLDTAKELKQEAFGGRLLVYGSGIIILLLLLIPAINIVTLSMANTNSQAEELAIRRAIGATQRSAFMQTMTENLLLVLTGTLIGIVGTFPTIRLIDHVLLNSTLSDGVTLTAGIDLWLVFVWVIPLSVLFSLLSGGVPAYLISKRNISETLKGGGVK